MARSDDSRWRSWQVQPTETPIAFAVCSSDNPNSSGTSTACVCRNWSAVFAVTTLLLLVEQPRAHSPDAPWPHLLRRMCACYYVIEVESELDNDRDFTCGAIAGHQIDIAEHAVAASSIGQRNESPMHNGKLPTTSPKKTRHEGGFL
jgi:hypothetical protein